MFRLIIIIIIVSVNVFVLLFFLSFYEEIAKITELEVLEQAIEESVNFIYDALCL